MSQSKQEFSRQRRLAQTAPILTAEHERALLQRAQAGDTFATAALVSSHMRLVVSIAGRHARDSLSAHDLIAEGTLGLLEAVRRHDCTREVRFATYATFWVRALVSRFALANRRIVGASSTRAGRKTFARLRGVERQLTASLGRFPSRSELAGALQVDEEEVQAVAASSCDVPLSHEGVREPVDAEPLPDALVAEKQLCSLRRRSIERALSVLSAKERAIVSQQLEDEPRSLADIARDLGVSRQRTGQIVAKARSKLRDTLVLVA